MPLPPITLYLSALLLAGCIPFGLFSTQTIASQTARSTDSKPFAGRWVDRDNTNIRMSVREDGGLYRINAGNEAYGYNLACLVKNTQAVCSGNGGRLEGQNFLYQSSFSLLPDGSAIESWRAFNNLQTASGQTTWIRSTLLAP